MISACRPSRTCLRSISGWNNTNGSMGESAELSTQRRRLVSPEAKAEARTGMCPRPILRRSCTLEAMDRRPGAFDRLIYPTPKDELTGRVTLPRH
jgi:hypothetical protein